MLDGTNLHMVYGHKVLRPQLCLEFVPSKPDPWWHVPLVCLWLAFKALIVGTGMLAATVIACLAFPQFAFPIGLTIGMLGFVAWNLLP